MIAVTIVAVTFLAGVIAGVLVLMRLAIGRERRDRRFSREAPTRLAAAARIVGGLHVTMPEQEIHADCDRTRIGAGRGRATR